MAPGTFTKKCNHILAKKEYSLNSKRKNTLDHILKPQSNKVKNKCQIFLRNKKYQSI